MEKVYDIIAAVIDFIAKWKFTVVTAAYLLNVIIVPGKFVNTLNTLVISMLFIALVDGAIKFMRK